MVVPCHLLSTAPAGVVVHCEVLRAMTTSLIAIGLRAIVFRDPGAAYLLGEACATGDWYRGKGLKSHRTALRWYHQAALAGHRDAQYELGFMKLLGEGTAADPAEGVRWMRAAADHGHAEAIRVLADSYARGQFGIAPDAQLAEDWGHRLEAHLAVHPEDRRDFEREAALSPEDDE